MSSALTNIIDKIFLAPTEKVEGDLQSYIKALDSGRFKNKMCYGISDTDKGFYTVDPVMRPGALYCGGMGSGKSIAMRFTVVTHIATNSENTFYILVDTLKGMTDYVQLFNDDVDDFGNVLKENPYKRNVVAAINDSAKIVPVYDMIYEECMARKEEFTRVGANNVYSYDKIMKEKDPNNKEIARIVICLEEFHAIPNSPQVKFNMKVDQVGSIAYKMKELMRVGRSYGIFFMFATQRATSEDIPTQLKPGLSMMMAFRMNSPGESSAMNLPHAQDIGMKQQGRCAYEGGFIQYPYISDKALDVILKQYYKPLRAKLLKAQPEDYHKALSGEGNDGMVWIKPYKDIIKFANQFDIKTIAKRLLQAFKIETELQLNETFVADLIGRKYEDKYAIRLITNREQGGKKEIESLIKGAEALGCNKILVIVSDVSAPMSLSVLEKGSVGNGIKSIVLDNDDLIQIANMLDSKKDLESNGNFNDFYLRYGIADVRDLNNNTQVQEEMVNLKDELSIIENKVESKQVDDFLEVEKTPLVEDNHSAHEELKEKLRQEREAYKLKLKEERKKFLEEVKNPIDSSSIDEVSVTEEEKKEFKEEIIRPSESNDSLDKDVLLKIRERLRQNIIKERGE